jgi:WD40 repeat protein
LSLLKKSDEVASSSDDQTIRIWKRYIDERWGCYITLSGYHSQPIYSVSWSKVSGHLASAAGDNAVCVFTEMMNDDHEVTYHLITRLENVHEADINHIEWHPTDPHRWITCGDDNLIKIWYYKDPE